MPGRLGLPRQMGVIVMTITSTYVQYPRTLGRGGRVHRLAQGHGTSVQSALAWFLVGSTKFHGLYRFPPNAFLPSLQMVCGEEGPKTPLKRLEPLQTRPSQIRLF